MSDQRLRENAASMMGHTVRAAIEQTKNNIRQRVMNEATTIAEEEVGKLLADLKFEFSVDHSFGFEGNAVQVNLTVKGVGEMWQGKENPK